MLPDFHQIAVNKKDIVDYKSFKELIELYDLEIVYDEPAWYILDGLSQNLNDFQKYWKCDS